ncbi:MULTISPECIES: iron ABC transporter permease [Anaerolinea]|uniref:ABC transporter permease n=1 Tax=Anaerolinea TaxID=233189 RepID=UPI0026123C97|nr:iron ABC transporter permease [Anaerolinea thermophila]
MNAALAQSFRKFLGAGWVILPLLFLGVFFLYPLGAILALAGKAGWLEGMGEAVWRQIARPLSFTVYQASLSTLLTLLPGLPMAWVFARFRFPGKRFLRVLMTLPFILPTVVVVAGFTALLGPRGWLNLWLMSFLGVSEPPIRFLNTLGAILTVHVFYNLSVIVRVVSAAWAGLDVRLEQAARTLGASPWRTFWRVTLPLLLPHIAGATLLVFLFDFTSFGVVLLLGGPRFATLEVEIYIQTMQFLNLPLAAVLSAVQLLCTLAVLALSQHLTAGAGVSLTPRVKGEGIYFPRTRVQRLAVAFSVLLLIVLVLFPLGALVTRSLVRLEASRGERGTVQTGVTLDYYRELFVNRRGSLFYVPPVKAAVNSLGYAFATMWISLGLGFPAAYALNRRGASRRLLDALLMLPLGTSAVSLGLGYVVAFQRPPLDVASFPLLIPIAHSLVALPFVVRTLQPALASIPRSLRDAAAVLGASPWRVWWHVDLPIVGRAVLVGAVFSFTVSMGEFGATALLARPEAPTLPVAIYRFISQPGAMNYGQAMAMSTLLMAVCALGMLALERLQHD